MAGSHSLPPPPAPPLPPPSYLPLLTYFARDQTWGTFARITPTMPTTNSSISCHSTNTKTKTITKTQDVNPRSPPLPTTSRPATTWYHTKNIKPWLTLGLNELGLMTMKTKQTKTGQTTSGKQKDFVPLNNKWCKWNSNNGK